MVEDDLELLKLKAVVCDRVFELNKAQLAFAEAQKAAQEAVEAVKSYQNSAQP